MENKLSKNSSLLVSKTALIIWAIFAALSAVAGFTVLSGLFLFFLLLFSFVRYWAARVMDGLSLEIECRAPRIFPGMETEIDYSLKNDKLLPIVWLELSQQSSENGCIIPDSSFEAYSYLKDGEERVEEISAFKRNFSLLMGYENITFTSHWRGLRRGIYCPKELLLRSGDGFGLSQVEKYYPDELLPEIVVYPKRVAVDIDIFLRQDWDKSYGAFGFKEDMSVLRGLRPYANTDSWKRINWRMAARQPGELHVNLYETVQPATAMFIIDGESYCNDDEALERDLEIVSSIIEQLVHKGVNCGLCLPKSKAFPALNFSPMQQAPAAELMYYLAGYDCLKNPVLDKENRPTGEYHPSAFELSTLSAASMDAGTVALFSNNPAKLSPKLLERLEHSSLIVFSSASLECPDKQLRIMHTSALEKGAGL